MRKVDSFLTLFLRPFFILLTIPAYLDFMQQAHPVSQATILRGLRWTPDLVYAVVAAVLFGGALFFYLFDPFGFETPDMDSWHHVGVLRELMMSPFHPLNPHIPTDDPSRYYTPVNVVAALIGRTAGMNPYALFGLTGAVSCLAFVVACRSFALQYYQVRWAPLVFMLTILFAWGTQRGHVGLHNYATFLSSAAYPATIALTIGIFLWSMCVRAISEEGASSYRISRHFALLTGTTALLFLTHQFSAVILLAGAGSFILFDKAGTLHIKVVYLAALVAGLLLSLAWPYFNPIDVITSTSDPRWQSPRADMNQFGHIVGSALPAFFGIFGMVDPANKRPRWQIALPAAFFLFAFAILYANGSSVAHRLPPAFTLYLQLALVWLLLAFFKRYGSDQRKMAWTIGLAIAFLLMEMVSAATPRIRELQRREVLGRMVGAADGMAAFIPSGAISFASKNVVYPLQSTGRRVVSIPRPEPTAPGLPERQDATDLFFNPATTRAERLELLRKWNASYVAFAQEDLSAANIESLRQLGRAGQFGRGFEVIEVLPEGNAAGAEQ